MNESESCSAHHLRGQRILVTGGAGYIGSHVVAALVRGGAAVTVVDDLSHGVRARIPGIELLELDLASGDAVERLTQHLRAHRVTAVIHLAARKSVPESIASPEYYFLQNIGGLAHVLLAMRASNVQTFVFSSTAAVYGETDGCGRVSEATPPAPINAYGESKLAGERLIREASRSWGLDAVCLRYFNVAGSDGDDLADASAENLVPIVVRAAAAREPVTIFGDDYPTADGSCVRDFIHVADLADAHLAALGYLDDRDVADVVALNVGTGGGNSVFDVIEAVEQAFGRPIDRIVVPRREGDPASVIADATAITSALDWSPRRTLGDMAASAARPFLCESVNSLVTTKG